MVGLTAGASLCPAKGVKGFREWAFNFLNTLSKAGISYGRKRISYRCLFSAFRSKIALKRFAECETKMNVKRGEIYYADLSPVVGSEQGGVRPVLIVQNDIGNRYSPTVIAAAITSQRDKTDLPTHIKVNAGGCGLAKDSVVLLEQVRTIDKRRLKERMGSLDLGSMDMVDKALSVSFGL